MTRNGGHRLVIGGIGVAALSLLVWSSVAIGSEPTPNDPTALRVQDVASSNITQDGYTFDVSSFGWSKPASEDEPAILSLSEGQDPQLKECGSDSWEESVLVLAPAGRAYCIAPVDSKDPNLMAAVRIAATKLIKGGEWTDAELNYLRLQVLMSSASSSNSAEFARLWEEFKAAGEALTPDEYAHVST